MKKKIAGIITAMFLLGAANFAWAEPTQGSTGEKITINLASRILTFWRNGKKVTMYPIAAGKQETQLGITYTDINMPASMSVEALAASLNGEPTATLPNNAGGETVNGTTAGVEAQPTSTQGAAQEDEEEA